jgi:hypothetical protein
MRNGLYSIHTRMVDAPGKGAGVFVLHDGQILGGNGLLVLTGSYTFDGRGRWKGELITEPYAFISEPGIVFDNQTVSIGFSGSYTDTTAECSGTGFVGKRSVAFESTMRFLAPSE